jgi:hypothetical protein
MHHARPTSPHRPCQTHPACLLQDPDKGPCRVAFRGLCRWTVQRRSHHLRCHWSLNATGPVQKPHPRHLHRLRAGGGTALQSIHDSLKTHLLLSPTAPRVAWGRKGKGHGTTEHPAWRAHARTAPRDSTSRQGWFPGLGGRPSGPRVAAPSRANLPSGLLPKRPPLPLRGQRRICTGFPILRHKGRHPDRISLAARAP